MLGAQEGTKGLLKEDRKNVENVNELFVFVLTAEDERLIAMLEWLFSG